MDDVSLTAFSKKKNRRGHPKLWNAQQTEPKIRTKRVVVSDTHDATAFPVDDTGTLGELVLVE